MQHCFVIVATNTKTGKSVECMKQYKTKEEAKALATRLNKSGGQHQYKVKAKSIKG